MKFDYICNLTAAAETTDLTVCQGQAVTLKVTPSETAAVVKWYATADGTTPIYTGAVYSPVGLSGTTSFWAEATNHPCVTARIKVTVKINPVMAAPQAVSSQNFTTGQTLADLSVTATGMLTWYADAALSTVLPSTTPLVNNTTYYVTQKSADACESPAKAILVQSFLTTSEVGQQVFTLYPNPTAGVVKVQSNVKVEEIQVLNVTGQILSNTNSQTEVDLSKYPHGVYLLKIKLENGSSVTKKVIKK
jgi:hypothetical protein